MKLADFLDSQSKTSIFIEALILTLAVGYFDYITGWEVSLFTLYAAPIFLVTWYGDRRTGVLFAVICGGVWFVANRNLHVYASSQGYLWATLNRVFYFIFVAIGATAMRVQREHTREKLEAMTRARELEQQIVRASEREQMRIGQDLHDGVCQSLAAIDCAASVLRSELAANSLPQAATAASIQTLCQQTLAEARGLARGIFPVQMHSQGLAAALQELANRTSQIRQIPVTLSVTPSAEIADPTAAMHLFRIAQEALSNAVRHAKAETIAIGLHRDERNLHLEVTDDGCGLATASDRSMGMGLRTMRYRAQLLGARFSVHSSPGKGTSVQCLLPLAKP